MKYGNKINILKMPKVYFGKNIGSILEKLDYSKLGEKVAIKVHFGEKGCETYLRPELARSIYNKLKSLGKEPVLVECNVLYKGNRTNSTDHIGIAKEHGFGDMAIDILDGENGGDFVEVNGCKLGKGLEKYDSLVVLTHFKGHRMAGFGGAIKNIGMGLGSRAGKLDMHSNVKPVISDRCIGCGVCVKNCNAGAITMKNGKAVIDADKCEGCAMCIAVCNSGAAGVPWGGRTSGELQERIAEYAGAVLKMFPNAVFINALANITKECDCHTLSQKPIMEDIGILYADDIVAIDKVSLDLANARSTGGFGKINSVDKNHQIEIAKERGLGSSLYELIEC
jgi:hypothetical protein